jgi:hypothetical protein
MKAISLKWLINDREIVVPLFERCSLRSHSECVLVCLFIINCTTFNMLVNDKESICQVSQKKGSCMEKTDVLVRSGYSMFQHKVRCLPQRYHEISPEMFVVQCIVMNRKNARD